MSPLKGPVRRSRPQRGSTLRPRRSSSEEEAAVPAHLHAGVAEPVGPLGRERAHDGLAVGAGRGRAGDRRRQRANSPRRGRGDVRGRRRVGRRGDVERGRDVGGGGGGRRPRRARRRGRQRRGARRLRATRRPRWPRRRAPAPRSPASSRARRATRRARGRRGETSPWRRRVPTIRGGAHRRASGEGLVEEPRPARGRGSSEPVAGEALVAGDAREGDGARRGARAGGRRGSTRRPCSTGLPAPR